MTKLQEIMEKERITPEMIAKNLNTTTRNFKDRLSKLIKVETCKRVCWAINGILGENKYKWWELEGEAEKELVDDE